MFLTNGQLVGLYKYIFQKNLYTVNILYFKYDRIYSLVYLKFSNIIDTEYIIMSDMSKCNIILDALQTLLSQKPLKNISVSEIASTAGISKGSIYYYFDSKNEILDALVERNFKAIIENARTLSQKTNISPFTRMAMIFQTCTNASTELMKNSRVIDDSDAQRALLHQKYISYIITELKPTLAEIIRQGIEIGEIHFDYPEALSEIVLIILTVKLDNTIVQTSNEDTARTIRGLISLLEKGTDNPKGSLNFLI